MCWFTSLMIKFADMKDQQGYDAAIKQLQDILSQLEGGTPLPMEQYVALAREAKVLIEACRAYLVGIEKEIESLER